MTAMPNVIAFRSPNARSGLRRPATLIRAAREGQQGWKRERDLPRLLHSDRCPAAGSALPRLRAQEAMLNEARLERDPEYDMQRHVLLMIAILAEMRAAVASAPQPVALAVAAMGRLSKAGSAALSGLGTAIPAHP